MAKIIEGKLYAKGLKFLLVVSRFNRIFAEQLLGGAIDCLLRHGASEEDIKVLWVPGAFEIPQTIKKCLEKGKYDAVIPLGVVIRGDTPHFDYIASEVSKGIAQLGLEGKVPVVFGILTCDTMEQAQERSSAKAGNKGWDAALSAIELANLWKEIDAQKP
ncbi:MAG: 6,7-dimethyl-8-ribityllumazine synthase [Thermoanaerobaculia bacterium]